MMICELNRTFNE